MSGRAKPAAGGERRGGSARRAWVVCIVLALGLGAIFWGPRLFQGIRTPAISEDFGVEDAVVALRIQAKDTPYLVLINEAGSTRSVEIEERGFEKSGIAWSSDGLSTGDPTHEYLLQHSGLRALPLPDPQDGSSERTRLATDTGFVVFTGSATGQQMVFIDGSGKLAAVDAGVSNPELAVCDGRAVMMTAEGVTDVTPETTDFNGFGMFDGLELLTCDAEHAYGIGEISDDPAARQNLRVWDLATGAGADFEVRYPGALIASVPRSFFTVDGRLYWVAEGRMWSVRAPAVDGRDGSDIPTVEAVEVAYLFDSLRLSDDTRYSPVVRTDEGALAISSGRAFGVALDEELVQRKRGRSYDRLDGMVITALDPKTGEISVEIGVDGIDFPRRDISVHSIAVDPEWAAGR